METETTPASKLLTPAEAERFFPEVERERLASQARIDELAERAERGEVPASAFYDALLEHIEDVMPRWCYVQAAMRGAPLEGRPGGIPEL